MNIKEEVRVVKNIAVSAWDLAKANADAIKVLHDELLEVKAEILNMSPHQFSMFVKMAFVDSYRVDCNLVNCINNCNR